MGGWGQEIQSKKKFLTTFPCMVHSHMANGMHAWCTKSCTLCTSWDILHKLKSKTCVMNTACTVEYQQCHVRALFGCLSECATLEVFHVQCTEIMAEAYWAVCVWRNFGLVANCELVSPYSMAADPLTTVSLAGHCCTRRLELLVLLFHGSQRS